MVVPSCTSWPSCFKLFAVHYWFMAENSFDIVSKIDLQEVNNAIQQAMKEIHTRFDLKDSKSEIKLERRKRSSCIRPMSTSSRPSRIFCRASW